MRIKLLFIISLLILSSCSNSKEVQKDPEYREFMGKYINIENPKFFFVLRKNFLCFRQYDYYGIKTTSCRYSVEKGYIYISGMFEPESRTKFDGKTFYYQNRLYTKDESESF